LKAQPSGDDSDRLAIETGRTIIKIAINKIIMLIISEITKNDQKFFTEALKNSEDEKVPDIPLRLLNNPPERKELTRKPIIIIMNNPLEKYDLKLLKLAPRSAKASTLKPSASFSVIMLFPNPALSALFIGIATRLASKNEHNHAITIPFHDFMERNIPVFKEVRIFIND
jgi:hypothetical protein